MARLNEQRQKQLEPRRMQFALDQINKLGLVILDHSDTAVYCSFRGCIVTFFPYSGWHTGKSIKDGRGWDNLYKQLTVKPDNNV